jgi:hypothetical protein
MAETPPFNPFSLYHACDKIIILAFFFKDLREFIIKWLL